MAREVKQLISLFIITTIAGVFIFLFWVELVKNLPK